MRHRRNENKQHRSITERNTKKTGSEIKKEQNKAKKARWMDGRERGGVYCRGRGR